MNFYVVKKCVLARYVKYMYGYLEMEIFNGIKKKIHTKENWVELGFITANM